MSLRPPAGFSPRTCRISPVDSGTRTIFSEQTIYARCLDNQSIPTIMSKLPSCIGVRSIGKIWSLRFNWQSRRTELRTMGSPLATSTVKGLPSFVLDTRSIGSKDNDTKLLSAPESKRTDTG
ncbi:hypothetical protein HanRHA438_Chr08g0371731 [Helianthus annuus]|nr:hypothetical protein HanRHA438_Chr08g0371731 [Helianthus annuus]